VNFSTASWTSICEKIVDVSIASGASANGFAATATEKSVENLPSRVLLLSSNPIKETIKLNMELDRRQKIQINILDIQGRTLFTNSGAYGQGKHQLLLTPRSLPPGSYVLMITGDSFKEAIKVIKQ